jgi:hypothetical protein
MNENSFGLKENMSRATVFLWALSFSNFGFVVSQRPNILIPEFCISKVLFVTPIF